MAVQQYGSGPYRPYQSTASNQNTAARQLPIGDGAGSQAQNSWQATTTNLPTGNSNGQSNNSPWGVAQQGGGGTGGTGPYNPNPQQRPQTGYNPSQLSPWNPTTPTAPTNTPGQQQTSQTWGAPQAWTPANFNTQALRDQNTAYMSTTLPYQQFMQNNYQYGADFNEAQRRWDSQNGWQQQMDQYNMGLTGRQQQAAEWQQQEAANQWGAQFGWTQQNDLFSQGLADRQLTGDQWYQQQQVGIAQQQNQIEDAYNQGRLSNEQRQIMLGEVTQQQENAFRYAQMGETMGWNREELASTNAYRQQQDQLARWQQQQQMQQQTAMQQAELAANRQNAVLQATGRSQGNGPSAIWQRRF
jgi:hypothetical protein